MIPSMLVTRRDVACALNPFLDSLGPVPCATMMRSATMLRQKAVRECCHLWIMGYSGQSPLFMC